MDSPEYLTVEQFTQKEHDRIFSKISTDLETGCWNWTAALNTYGYGEVWFHGRLELTHRLLYAWKNGPIPQGFGADIPCLDHIVCDNPRCCNPEHLRLVSHKENLARTNSVSSVNARKTHCIHGHSLPDKPNRSDGSGRYCPICRKRTSHERYMRLRYGPDAEEYLKDKRERARKYYHQSRDHG